MATSADRSDEATHLFWEAVTPEGEYSHDYNSISDIVSDVDLIVIGRITEVYTGDFKTTDGTSLAIWAKFQVDNSLKGTAVSKDPGFVDIALTTSPAWEYARDNVPNEQLLLFLMNEADYRARVGQVSVDPDVERYTYWRPNEQAVLRNVDGLTDVIDKERLSTDYGDKIFPMTVVGDSFDTTTAAVRTIIAKQ